MKNCVTSTKSDLEIRDKKFSSSGATVKGFGIAHVVHLHAGGRTFSEFLLHLVALELLLHVDVVCHLRLAVILKVKSMQDRKTVPS